MKAWTFKKLVKLVSDNTGYPVKEAEAICGAFIACIMRCLLDGDSVRIPQLGKFIWKQLGDRRLRLPHATETQLFPGRLRISFKPGGILKKGPESHG